MRLVSNGSESHWAAGETALRHKPPSQKLISLRPSTSSVLVVQKWVEVLRQKSKEARGVNTIVAAAAAAASSSSSCCLTRPGVCDGATTLGLARTLTSRTPPREDLSDPSAIDQRQCRAGGAVGARASRAEHAAMSVAEKLSPAAVEGAVVDAVAGTGGGRPWAG